MAYTLLAAGRGVPGLRAAPKDQAGVMVMKVRKGQAAIRVQKGQVVIRMHKGRREVQVQRAHKMS
jgi:hypothetical protein